MEFSPWSTLLLTPAKFKSDCKKAFKSADVMGVVQHHKSDDVMGIVQLHVYLTSLEGIIELKFKF